MTDDHAATESAVPPNRELAVRLAQRAQAESDHRQRALRAAARAALTWPQEAAGFAAQGRLASLPRVGPWVAQVITELAAEPPHPPSPLCDDFRSHAEMVGVADRLMPHIRGDHQCHSTWSDGHSTLAEMVSANAERGRSHMLITDHTQGLKIANGMAPERLAAQHREIDGLDTRITVLRGVEMNISPDGAGDMDERSLASLDLILGAFHSQLRRSEDQTERYLAALRNPWVDVLAHPRGRMWNHRLGLTCDWPAVFAEAARLDKAVEIDGLPDRQDLNPELVGIALDSGVRFSLGSDAHHVLDLGSLDHAAAIAASCGVPAERIINCLEASELCAWAASHRRP